ncbi:ABC transporter family protein [Burkholderia thailandensis MSMB121]|uniref:ATP-binding cassette domain-containing protein n=1 Tax=Burkholderia humptydooensis TaxID=430531 RepID=UPI000327FC8C|nr:ATP-binding cassette domain-containing protein [Burkholderia humptydooensis]AGK50823.1 ABC transporter family protein [Burkholderia thailandensis MSMB121]ATF32570.1 ABC transporter ATP-binding protein [Burkholderia thailandensis]KST71242.1 peptide ABC transporter ATP-binding protein [Burkholderia humptydooensis]
MNAAALSASAASTMSPAAVDAPVDADFKPDSQPDSQPASPAADVALELRALTRTFALKRGLFRAPAPLRAVDCVSLRLHRGETLALVGESGCGKSTLAKMLLGLLPPTSGDVLIDGRPIDPRDARRTAQRIQPVFQDPYSSLNPRKTVAQIVGMPLRVHRRGARDEQDAEVRRMLDLVGMPQRTHGEYPGQLSGGQRQRVAIARALILRPGILVCDEPTSALDVSVQAQILNLLLDLKAEFGLSYLFISHDLGVVEHLADRVAVMERGRIVEQDAAERVFAQPAHPYTRRLLASALTPEPGLGLPDPPAPDDGSARRTA